MNTISEMIKKRRKLLGYTQQELAGKLNISPQAVSKWENGAALPDLVIMPRLAQVLETTVDGLLGYQGAPVSKYDERYRGEEYYWGLNPGFLCYELMKLKPPTRPYRVLEIGCGEGKDAVFLARCGYQVMALDESQAGIDKALLLAEKNGVYVDFFRANALDYQVEGVYDIIYSSGFFDYLPDCVKVEFTAMLKEHTADGGLNVLNAFVDKPFMKKKAGQQRTPWKSGELFLCYHDWLFHKCEEVIFDCNSGGVPHQHCMDILIAEKMSG
ncbi:MAG: helix-turn-helix domain-containing protein [bacterium]|nr:helix-turn-helix domain-containing protein [bacterium]MCM1376745.1 helix-turn-helix domain-containing protein [Muribaculum sp.]